jgi:hypothetical protein
MATSMNWVGLNGYLDEWVRLNGYLDGVKGVARFSVGVAPVGCGEVVRRDIVLVVFLLLGWVAV